MAKATSGSIGKLMGKDTGKLKSSAMGAGISAAKKAGMAPQMPMKGKNK